MVQCDVSRNRLTDLVYHRFARLQTHKRQMWKLLGYKQTQRREGLRQHVAGIRQQFHRETSFGVRPTSMLQQNPSRWISQTVQPVVQLLSQTPRSQRAA